MFKIDEIAYAIDSTIVYNNPKYLDSLINIQVSKAKNEKLRKEFNKGFNSTFNLGTAIADLVANNGCYFDFTKRYVDEQNNEHTIFRVYGEDYGLNYYDFKFGLVDDELKITDVFIYSTGEYVSKSIKDFSDEVNDDVNSKEINFGGHSSMNRLSLIKMKIIRRLLDNQEYIEAYNQYQVLPKNLRESKIFQSLLIQIASGLDEEKYLKILDNYKKLFPKDPSLDLILVDAYFIRGDYDNAIKSINRLSKSVGSDDFLDFYRANTYYAKKDYYQAKQHYYKLLYNYPMFTPTYDSLLVIYDEENMPEKSVQILDLIMENFGTTKKDIKSNIKNEYPKLYKTRVFKKWLKK